MSVTVKEVMGRSVVLAGRTGLGREVLSPQTLELDIARQTSWRDVASTIICIRPRQLAYLCALPAREKQQAIRALLKLQPACVVVNSKSACRELLARADAANIPVIKSGDVPALRRRLVARIALKTSLHGVLVQIFGLGTLILGESAVGKSEAALDLVLRGHKLVADDLVLLERSNAHISGMPAEIGAGLLQIRGLGIINVRALYGDSATVPSCMVGLVVELEEWREGRQYSLVGLRERRYRLLGANLPYLKLPVKPGRNMATLIEVAARNQMLKNRGIFTARDLDKKLRKRLSA